MKRVLVVALMLCAVAWAAFAGPTVTYESLWYGEGWQMVWGVGMSYVSDENWGGFADFKFLGMEYESGDEWNFALVAIPDLQFTYDLSLYEAGGESVLILRPGLGAILPFAIGASGEAFGGAINDIGLAVSLALVVPYDITIRGEMFYNAAGVSWGLGLTLDWFGLEDMFRSDAAI